ncbi:MAG: PspA/IM30 family protein [Bacteroidetes bacterium]|nr:PspA/IM30 family protein [Bacteroidota bacterium]
MWKRFVRAIKALFGGAVAAIEDPKLILEQNIRELNDQVPRMNQSIATVKANVTLLENELRKFKTEYNDLISKMRAAINAGRDDIAANYALRVESLKGHIAQTQAQHETAVRAYEKSLEVKKAFMRERERKINEAREALRAHERSKWQAKIADTMEQFEVGGIDQTHDEMVRKLNEKAAVNEARVDMVLDSIDTDSMKIDEEASKLRAMDLVNQYKLEMGLGNTAPAQQESTSAPAEQERSGDSL